MHRPQVLNIFYTANIIQSCFFSSILEPIQEGLHYFRSSEKQEDKKSKDFSIDNQRKLMDKTRAELLLNMFEEYDNFAKDTELIINAIKKNLDGEKILGEVEIEVTSGHVKELIKNLQGIDNFIDKSIKNEK